MSNIITLRSVYAKVKKYHLQPMKMANGLDYPFVRKVRYDSNGQAEMIMSDADRNSEESRYYIPEDLDIIIEDGTTFDLDNPLERNKWECIKDSDLIAPSRDSKDRNGNLIIDGDKQKYGTAELYVDIPGEASAKKVNIRKLITQACTYIEKDTPNGILTKCKLLGKDFNYSPLTDAIEFLYLRADMKPLEIIDLYTSGDTALRLLLIDGKEKGVIIRKEGLYMYGDTILGATDDAVLGYMKTPTNKAIVDLLKRHVYPDYITTEVKKEPAVKTTKK